jgi:thiol-disulfide isomerase/thioredoxin
MFAAVIKIFALLLVSLLPFTTAALAADLAQFKTADELWRHIAKLQEEGPQGSPRSLEEHRACVAAFLREVDAALAEFDRRFPDDPRRFEAKLMRLQMGELLANAEGRTPDAAQTEKTLQEIATASQAPTNARAEASAMLIQLHAATATNLAPINAEITAFEKQFPNDPQLGQLRLLQARLNQSSDSDKAVSLLKTVAADTNTALAQEAQNMLKEFDLSKKPLTLKFTAVDGSQVDLEKLRGKVVLLDFWATWCGPCIRQIPSVVATYKKLHEKGFEIVGISLDRDKQRLVAFTKDHEMSWPQFFDGKMWENSIAVRFNIHAIPATWLVDKKGLVRSFEGDLATQIEKLLAE